MAKRKPFFGSTEPQSRKVMNDMRRTLGMPPIPAKRKTKKKAK